MASKKTSVPGYAAQLQKQLQKIEEGMKEISNVALLNELDETYINYVDEALKKMNKIVMKDLKTKRERVDLTPPGMEDDESSKEKVSGTPKVSESTPSSSVTPSLDRPNSY
jgi:hypothetical protein